MSLPLFQEGLPRSGSTTIGTGGDFETIAEWSANVKALGTLQENQVGQLIDNKIYTYGADTDLEFSAVTLNGFTITLQGVGAGIHGGDPDSGARVEQAISNNPVYRNTTNIIIKDFVVKNLTSGGYNNFAFFNTGNGCEMHRVIASCASTTINAAPFHNASGATPKHYTCLAIGGHRNFYATATVEYYNCTGINGADGIHVSSNHSGVIQNCVLYGYAGAAFTTGTQQYQGTYTHNSYETGDTSAATLGTDSVDDVILTSNPFEADGHTPTASGQLDGAGVYDANVLTGAAGNSFANPPSIGAYAATVATGISGTLTSSAPSFNQSSTGALSTDAITGTLASKAPIFNQSLIGTLSVDAITGAINNTIPTFTQNSVGVALTPSVEVSSAGGGGIGSYAIGSAPVSSTGNASLSASILSTGKSFNQSSSGVTGTSSKFGTALSVNSPFSQSVVGTVSADAITGTIGSINTSFSQSGSGVVSIDAITGVGTSYNSSFQSTATGIITNEAISGSLDSKGASFNQSSSGTVLLEAISGDITSSLPGFNQQAYATLGGKFGPALSQSASFSQSALGALSNEAISGSIGTTLPSFNQSAVGTKLPDDITGSITSRSISFTQSSNGTITVDAITGVGTTRAPSFSQSGVGTLSTKAISGTILSVSSSFSQAGTGAVSLDAITGVAVTQLPSFTQSSVGTLTSDNISGFINTSGSSFGSTAVGTAGAEAITGDTTSSAASFSQSGEIRIKVIHTGVINSTLSSFVSKSRGTQADPTPVVYPYHVTVNGMLDDEYMYAACLSASIMEVTSASIGDTLSANIQSVTSADKSVKLTASIKNTLEATLWL